jgi:superfamily II DNA/RNA helicase
MRRWPDGEVPRPFSLFDRPGYSHRMSFSTLGLSPKVLEAVTAAGYTTPTAIQAEAIPHALARRDVLGLAQTGSGKTAAFVLPMLHLLEKGRARARMPRTLILEPTRELAVQVQEAFESLGKKHNISVALLIGGVAFDPQAAKIDRGADVVIATPGRLLDHFERGKLLLTGVELLVIDEADRMLDMGFIPDIERICKLLPFTRQTLFFSATMPAEIQRLTAQFLHNPVQVETSSVSSAAPTISQFAVKVPSEAAAKRDALRKLIRSQENVNNAIIFANRKTTVALLEKSLKRHGFNAGALHGDMDQSARLKMLTAFRTQEVTFLIASDVAARGLDIPEVSHVFNFDVPIHAEDYVHRIGRTGRAGREGHAYMMVSSADTKHLKAIEVLLKKDMEWFSLGDAPAAADPVEDAPKPVRERRTREKKPEGKPRAVVEAAPVVEATKPVAKPERRPRRDFHEQSDAPDHGGFNAGNMPAFLQRPAKTGSR